MSCCTGSSPVLGNTINRIVKSAIHGSLLVVGHYRGSEKMLKLRQSLLRHLFLWIDSTNVCFPKAR